MTSSLQSYRICCRCATVELPDYIISDVRPSSDCHSVLDSFLRHFNIILSQSDVSVVALIFSGRRLNIKDSVGAVFGSVPVTILLLPLQDALAHAILAGPLYSCNHPTYLYSSSQATAARPFVRRTCSYRRNAAQVHGAVALSRPRRCTARRTCCIISWGRCRICFRCEPCRFIKRRAIRKRSCC
jgi:hypothetical protein